MNTPINKAIYPIYVQSDSIATFYNQIFESAEESRKIAKTSGEDKATEKKVGIALSLLQLLGLEGNYRLENSVSSDYTEETIQIIGPENKLKLVRKELSKQGLLYNLNYSLKKKRPFGSFVDFECLASFIALPTTSPQTTQDVLDIEDPNEFAEAFLLMENSKFIQIQGTIEDCKFSTICSMRYFETQSWLYDAISSKSKKKVPLIGFGIVTDFDLEKKEIDIKALMLAMNTEGFRGR